MAGANFTLVPTWVYPLEPEYNTIETQSESMKKQYQSLSSTPVQKYRLVFEGLSDANRGTILNHYHTCLGGYDYFSWQSVPSYIDTNLDGTPDGSNMTGRWVPGTLNMTPRANGWDVEIVFEKDN